jgi:gas vesicle protein
MSDGSLNGGKGIIIAAVVGAVVGAGVALLFAPRSGSETRGWLVDKSRAAKDRLKSAVDQGREAACRMTTELSADIETTGVANDRTSQMDTGSSRPRS